MEGRSRPGGGEACTTRRAAGMGIVQMLARYLALRWVLVGGLLAGSAQPRGELPVGISTRSRWCG
jgi:hypothetical protein